MHTPEYLKNWYYQHLFGTYPKRQFNPAELPEIILNEFGIDKDELYFAGRNQMEAKHYQDAIDWKNYFDLKSVFLFGCGFGQRVKVLDELGCVAVGFELSEYAVMNKLSKDIFQQDITNFKIKGNSADLTVAYDLLEHLTYECLDEAIDVLNGFSKKHILISVPFKGTPNCENDPTHIIKEDRDWWIKQFIAKGLKEVNVPAHFLYKEQLLIFKK
jgi:SAM-dependent methyltransferase